MPLASALAMFLCLGEWNHLDEVSAFIRSMDRFAWVRASLMLAFVTCLAGVGGAGRRSTSSVLGSPMMYAAVIVPIIATMMLMDTQAGVIPMRSGRLFFPLLLILMFIHGIGFRIVRDAVERSEDRQ